MRPYRVDVSAIIHAMARLSHEDTYPESPVTMEPPEVDAPDENPEGFLIRIPRYFYQDHMFRDLDTPEPIESTSRHVWVRNDDPDLPELMDDAAYYADEDGPDAPHLRGLRASARATLKAIWKARVEHGA